MNEDLKTYIQDQLGKGVLKDQIADSLKEEGGWSPEDVQAVFSEIDGDSSSELPNQEVSEAAPVSKNWDGLEKHKHKNKFLIPILVVVFLAIVGFVVAVFMLAPKTPLPANDGGNPTENIDSSSIVNKYGFSFAPPATWTLWEGRSAYMDSINTFTKSSIEKNKAPTTIEELKAFQIVLIDFTENQLSEKMKLWEPQNSSRLIYTKGPVDTTSRDRNVLSTYLEEESKYEFSEGQLSRPFVTINLQVYDEEYKNNNNLGEVNILSSQTINFLGTSALYQRTLNQAVKTESNVFLETSLGGGKILRLETLIANNTSDEDAISYLVEFSRKLLIDS